MNFEIAPTETEVSLSWEEAILYCQFLNHNGSGWRLPTIDELNLMHKNRTYNMKHVPYWSSTEYHENNEWAMVLQNGYRYRDNKNRYLLIRAIRDKI